MLIPNQILGFSFTFGFYSWKDFVVANLVLFHFYALRYCSSKHLDITICGTTVFGWLWPLVELHWRAEGRWKLLLFSVIIFYFYFYYCTEMWILGMVSQVGNSETSRWINKTLQSMFEHDWCWLFWFHFLSALNVSFTFCLPRTVLLKICGPHALELAICLQFLQELRRKLNFSSKFEHRIRFQQYIKLI